jgi:hypothetical protein
MFNLRRTLIIAALVVTAMISAVAADSKLRIEEMKVGYPNGGHYIIRSPKLIVADVTKRTSLVLLCNISSDPSKDTDRETVLLGLDGIHLKHQSKGELILNGSSIHFVVSHWEGTPVLVDNEMGDDALRPSTIDLLKRATTAVITVNSGGRSHQLQFHLADHTNARFKFFSMCGHVDPDYVYCNGLLARNDDGDYRLDPDAGSGP